MRTRHLLLGLLLGLFLSWLWSLEEETAKPDAPAVPPPAPPARPRSSASAKPAQKDPLVDIEGIGPAYERALNAIGVFTFAQLAAQDADSLAASLAARVTAERIRRERWIEQAKKLAK